jgi:hypothetical protein
MTHDPAAQPQPAPTRFLLTLEARSNDPVRVTRSLAILLKMAARSFGFRCVSARELPPPLTPVTSAR